MLEKFIDNKAIGSVEQGRSVVGSSVVVVCSVDVRVALVELNVAL